MFIQLNHKKLEVYTAISAMIKETYKVSLLLPPEERFNLVQQLRRAAISVKLNLAEGSTRRTEPERIRFLEIARGSVVEIDAAIEAAFDLNYVSLVQLEALGLLLNKCFAMLSKMMAVKNI